MGEVLSWLEDEKRPGASSLDWVEILVATENEASSEATDAFAETLEQRTFREYVEHLYANQRGGLTTGSAARQAHAADTSLMRAC
jgi:hypothetical protein